MFSVNMHFPGMIQIQITKKTKIRVLFLQFEIFNFDMVIQIKVIIISYIILVLQVGNKL